MMLAMGGWSSKKTLTTGRLIKELQLWQTRTKIIRRKIWGRDSTRRAIVSRSDIIKTFFSQPRPDLIGLFRVTELFVFAVDAALACSDALIREVSGPRFPGDPAPALWSAWVALIMKFMATHGFSVQQVRGSNRVIDSRFVGFVAALQKTLPLGEQRRRTTQSLKRGIQDVLPLSNSTSFETLLFMMCIWGAAGADRLRALHISSKTEFGKEIAAFLAPFEERLTLRKNQLRNDSTEMTYARISGMLWPLPSVVLIMPLNASLSRLEA
jgi:hypothetical protein